MQPTTEKFGFRLGVYSKKRFREWSEDFPGQLNFAFLRLRFDEVNVSDRNTTELVLTVGCGSAYTMHTS